MEIANKSECKPASLDLGYLYKEQRRLLGVLYHKSQLHSSSPIDNSLNQSSIKPYNTLTSTPWLFLPPHKDRLSYGCQSRHRFRDSQVAVVKVRIPCAYGQSWPSTWNWCRQAAPRAGLGCWAHYHWVRYPILAQISPLKGGWICIGLNKHANICYLASHLRSPLPKLSNK